MITVLSGLLFIIGFAFLLLFFYSLTRSRNRVAGLFSLMCLTIAIYVFGYAFEIRSDNVEQIKFFLKMEYFGSPFMTAFWLLFSYKFYFNRNPSFKINIAVMIIPVLTLFFCVTNEYHHLFYREVTAVQYDGFILANLIKGPWYYIYTIYSYIILLVGMAAFYFSWHRSLYTMSKQSFLMFIGTFFPLIVNFLYLIGLAPFSIDLTPFGLSILAVFYFIALFRYDFLEMGEIIRGVAFSEISEGIIVVDSKKRLIDFNKAAQKIFSALSSENIGRDLTSLEKINIVLDKESTLFEASIKMGNENKYFEFRVTKLEERGRILGSVYFIRDITEHTEMIKTLDMLASYDALTQIYNRRRVMEEAAKEALRAKRHNSSISVMMLDIDFFKKVNDIYGHLTGDEVLKSVVNTCKKRIRNTDTIGRYGGEEFLLILPEASLEDAKSIAEQIRQNIEDMEIAVGEFSIRVTVSIGLAAIENSNEDINILQLINKADLALYQAKRSGRNRICSQ